MMQNPIAAQNGKINFKEIYRGSPVDVNIKWFQMRIIHRIIGTNVMLKEMGVTNNN